MPSVKQNREKSPLGESSDEIEEFFTSFFRDLSDQGATAAQTFPEGTAVFYQDDPATFVYFIERGMLKLMRSGPDGSEIIVGIRRGPALIGGSAVLLGKPHFYRAVTLVSSSLRSMQSALFLSLVKSNPHFSWQTSRLLSQALYNCMNRLEAIGCMPARQRFELFLGELLLSQNSDASQRSAEVTIPLKHQEVAQILAITPEHFCRVLREMEEAGMVRRRKGALAILDPARLLDQIRG